MNPHHYGKWALVTGASDGVGRALAEKIAAAGMNVVLVARGKDKLQALADDLTSQHGIETTVADLADPADLADLAAG